MEKNKFNAAQYTLMLYFYFLPTPDPIVFWQTVLTTVYFDQ